MIEKVQNAPTPSPQSPNSLGSSLASKGQTKDGSLEKVQKQERPAAKVELENKEKLDRKKEVEDKIRTYSPKAISVDGKFKGLKKPAILFIGGLNMISDSSGPYDGMKIMAEAVDGARYYEWDQKDKVIKEVMKRRKDQAVVLVGHSLGGDTAVEIAHELNTLEKGFRKVDLLVTIDSVGGKNDIIPDNVKRNVNYIGRAQGILNDSPNVAYDSSKTQVENQLRDEDHTEIDDTREVQAEIVNSITNAIFSKKFELKF